MHKSNKRQTLVQRRERQALITTLMSGKTEHGRIAPMLRPEAEKLASAILTKGHSTWAYGPVFLTKTSAKAAGFTHKTQCRCGHTAHPL